MVYTNIRETGNDCDYFIEIISKYHCEEIKKFSQIYWKNIWQQIPVSIMLAKIVLTPWFIRLRDPVDEDNTNIFSTKIHYYRPSHIDWLICGRPEEIV